MITPDLIYMLDAIRLEIKAMSQQLAISLSRGSTNRSA
jgi:hypothetical protein